jgi:hypothetical protein
MHQSFVAVLLVVVMMLTNIFMTWKVYEKEWTFTFSGTAVTTSVLNRIAEDRALAHIF